MSSSVSEDTGAEVLTLSEFEWDMIWSSETKAVVGCKGSVVEIFGLNKNNK